jgi:hypothetical protein
MHDKPQALVPKRLLAAGRCGLRRCRPRSDPLRAVAIDAGVRGDRGMDRTENDQRRMKSIRWIVLSNAAVGWRFMGSLLLLIEKSQLTDLE